MRKATRAGTLKTVIALGAAFGAPSKQPINKPVSRDDESIITVRSRRGYYEKSISFNTTKKLLESEGVPVVNDSALASNLKRGIRLRDGRLLVDHVGTTQFADDSG